MATVNFDLHNTFEKELRTYLERHIKEAVRNLRVQAMQDLSDEIDKWVAATAVKIFEVCSFDRAGRDLRITVDTSKVFAESKEE